MNLVPPEATGGEVSLRGLLAGYQAGSDRYPGAGSLASGELASTRPDIARYQSGSRGDCPRKAYPHLDRRQRVYSHLACSGGVHSHLDVDWQPMSGGDEVPDLRTSFAEAARKIEEREAARPRKHRADEPRPAEMEPASGWLEARDFETPLEEGELDEARDRRRRTYSRQVGIRLSWSQYAELSNAADLYGVAPGTMARMLVRRGARSVLDSRRRYDLEMGGID